MSERTELEYIILGLQVTRLTQTVYGEVCLIGDACEPDRVMVELLDKAKGLPQGTPIPEKFYSVSREVEYGVYRHDVKLTYRELEPDWLKDSFLVFLYESLCHEIPTLETRRVHWYLFSDTPLSFYDISCIIRQHGDTFHPKGFPVIVTYDLVCIWKGEGT